MTKPSANWYDYPQYYELAFKDETRPEADFIEEACRRYALGRARTIVEPGCGGGRLIVELARRGWRMIGLDTSPPSLAYLRQKLKRRGLRAQVLAGDMTDFSLPRPADAAICTFNTFRHLTSEAAALAQLRAVARNVRPGGVYVLGLHLLPLDADEHCVERWTARAGRTRVTYTLRVMATDRRRRIERLRVNMLVRRPAGELRLATEFDFRMYTASQFRRLLRKAPEWELLDVFDFNYLIDEPLPLDDELSDAVFILRRK